MKKNHVIKILFFAVMLAALLGVSVCALAETTETEHNWTGRTRVQAATCDMPALYEYVCSICGNTRTVYEGERDSSAHQWGAWVVDVQPSCTSTGHQYRQCTISSHHTQETTLPALGHSYTSSVTRQPTCTEVGIRTYTCIRNDSSYNEEIPAIGHAYGAYIQTTAPTCTTQGVETSTCANNSAHVLTRPIAALDHLWGAWTVTTPATCTTPGQETHVCQRDSSHVETRSIPALNHNWDNGTVTTPATCDNPGVKTYVCLNDSSHTKTESIPALGHNWDNGVVTKPATMLEEGEKVYTCQNDPSHTRTVVLPKLSLNNNTVCAFGPRLRESYQYLYPNNPDLWYMYTPFDASQNGVQTYELVASNTVIVGTVTLTVRDGYLTVDYQLADPSKFEITLEFFTVLNKITDISQYEPEQLMEIRMYKNRPINMAETFGDDTNLVLYFCSRCSYSNSAKYTMLRYESLTHQRLLESMLNLMNNDI